MKNYREELGRNELCKYCSPSSQPPPAGRAVSHSTPSLWFHSAQPWAPALHSQLLYRTDTWMHIYQQALVYQKKASASCKSAGHILTHLSGCLLCLISQVGQDANPPFGFTIWKSPKPVFSWIDFAQIWAQLVYRPVFLHWESESPPTSNHLWIHVQSQCPSHVLHPHPAYSWPSPYGDTYTLYAVYEDSP